VIWLVSMVRMSIVDDVYLGIPVRHAARHCVDLSAPYRIGITTSSSLRRFGRAEALQRRTVWDRLLIRERAQVAPSPRLSLQVRRHFRRPSNRHLVAALV